MSAAPIAITGATGFLGRLLVKAARAAGHPVVAVVRNPERARDLAGPGVEIRTADLADPAALEKAFAGCAGLIANAAMLSGRGGLSEMRRVNVAGTENTLRACARSGTPRVVMVSSVAVYEPKMGTSFTESGPMNALVPTGSGGTSLRHRWSWRDLTTDWKYSLSKTEAEQHAWTLAQELGLQLTTVRPGPIYGPGDDKVTKVLLRLSRWPVLVAPTVGVPFVHGRDVASACVAALKAESAVGRAYNLCAPPESPYTFFRALRAARGRGPWVLPLPVPTYVGYDSQAASRDLGFSPMPLSEGVRDLEPT
jgi:nucleoside-diphosphate-sugar epimerase